MTKRDELIQKEIKKVIYSDEDLKRITGKSFLVTGGNGLIGSFLLNTLAYLNKKHDLNLRLYGTVRSKDKINSVMYHNSIAWIIWDLVEEFDFDKDIDFVIHTASSTSSNYFIEHPVELIEHTIHGFETLMKYSKEHPVESFVYLSSLEIYGLCNDDVFLTEDKYYPLDSFHVRNSYPISKKLIENLGVSYQHEYGVPFKSVRLGQVFGPGVDLNDKRVFASFSRSVVNGENIKLQTKGRTKHSYLSLPDSVQGIIKALLYGGSGESFNLGSDNSYISIYELAELFIQDTDLKIEILEKENKQCLPQIQFGLDTTKIKKIGFSSTEGIDDMVRCLIEYFKTSI